MANPHSIVSPSKNQILLKFGGRAGVPVRIDTAAYGRNGSVSFQTQGGELVQLVGLSHDLANLFRQLSEKIKPLSVAEVEANKLTPERVIEYFEQSPVLYVYADDVKSALAGSVDQVYYDVEKLRPYVIELINKNGIPIRGYTRRAAEILFNDPGKNGGNNLARIKAAMNLLTTTQAETPTVVHLDKIAA